jgi:hypothetical protein
MLCFIRVFGCLRKVRNVSHRHKIASSNKNDVLDRKILSHNDWQIATDVSKDRNSFIFRVKLSMTIVLYNCVNEGIEIKKGLRKGHLHHTHVWQVQHYIHIH